MPMAVVMPVDDTRDAASQTARTISVRPLSPESEEKVAHPTNPHWCLPWLAVAPALHGRGLGARARTRLVIVDA